MNGLSFLALVALLSLAIPAWIERNEARIAEERAIGRLVKRSRAGRGCAEYCTIGYKARRARHGR